MDEQSIFLEALHKSHPEELSDWLDESCGEDRQLRKRVEALLQRHHEASGFLEYSADAMEATCLAATGSAIASGHASVLRSIGRRYGEVKGVALPEAEQQGEDPVVQMGSPQIPKSNPADRYQFLGEIARGGMGAVIKGRDTDLGRDLAVKVLLDDHKDKPEIVQRFVEEAQIGGQLQHPGIAPVYELGQFADQRPFFTMKLVKGKTLAALLSKRKAPEHDQPKLLGIFEQVCQTMAYAHSRHVIHRDLKPANIMVGAFGEVQVMDWGLAKVLQSGGVADETKAAKQQQDMSVIETIRSGGSNTFSGGPSVGSQTRSGSVMGTPAYMPPEQAIGQAEALDERSDVFGLGAILCEILTGRPPYVAEDGNEVLRKAVRGDLADCQSRLHDCDAHPELVHLTIKCLAAEPAQRPEDAGVVAEQITSHLESVSRKLKQAEMRRKLTYVIAASLLLLVTGLGTGGVWLQAKETEAANQVAAAEREQVEQEKKNNEELKQTLYASEIQLASAQIGMGKVQQAARTLANHVPQKGETDRRGFEWHYLNRLCVQPRTVGHADWSKEQNTFAGRISRDWKRILNSSVVEGNGPETRHRLVVTNPDSGEEIWSTTVSRPVSTEHVNKAFGISADGSTVYFYLHQPTTKKITRFPIDIFKLNTGEHHVIELRGGEKGFNRFSGGFYLNCEISPDGRYFTVELPTGGEEETATDLSVWKVDQPEPLYSVQLNRSWDSSRNLVFSDDGAKMLVLSNVPVLLNRGIQEEDVSGTLQVFETRTGEELHHVQMEPFYLLGRAAFSPDGSKIAVTGFNRRHSEFPVHSLLWILDTNSGRRLATISPDANAILAPIVFSPDGQLLCLPRSGELFAAVGGASLGKLAQMEQMKVRQDSRVRFTADGRSVIAISSDGDLMRWQVPRPRFELEGWPFGGGTFVSTDGTHSVRIPSQYFRRPDEPVHVFGIDGSHHARKIAPAIRAGSRDCAFSHDCRLLGLITQRDDHPVRDSDRLEEVDQETQFEVTLWDSESGKPAGTLWSPLDHEEILDVVGVPKRDLMAGVIQRRVAGDEATQQLLIWDLTTRTTKTKIDLKGFESIVFSEDGKTAAIETAGKDDEHAQLTLYKVDDGSVGTQFSIRPMRGGRTDPAVFKRDGSAIALRNLKRQCVDVWDVQSGRKLQTFNGIGARSPFTWSADGDRFIVFERSDAGVDQGVLKVLDAKTGRQLLVHSDHGIPNLSFKLLPDGNRIISWTSVGPPRIWDATPKEDQ